MPIHLSLATADAVDRDFQRRMMHEIMSVLREISENPQYRAASDAEHERWTLHPTPQEQAAKQRNQATLERFMRAREARRAEAAAASNSTSDV